MSAPDHFGRDPPGGLPCAHVTHGLHDLEPATGDPVMPFLNGFLVAVAVDSILISDCVQEFIHYPRPSPE